MRVTNNMISIMYSQGMNSTLNSLLQANQKVSAGRNLLNPEDDVTNYLTAYSLQVMSNEATQYGRNAENALTWLNNEDSLLQSAHDYLSTALNELAVQGMNDSQNAESRKAIAGDVKSILDAMVDIGNSEYLGRYIFSGYETETMPFTSGEREVSAVVSSRPGAEALSKKLYGDMSELKEGEYTLSVSVESGIAYVNLYNSLDQAVLIDSNGSDETTTKGNLTSRTLVTDYKGETIINTGVGVGLKIPDGITSGSSFEVSFYYTPGDDITYQGDDGEITTKIASNQSATINVSGIDTFMETYRTITGTAINTINGLDISASTKFSQIDGANASSADYIAFTGTDHNGYAIGTARVSSPGNVALDMTDASEEERTITINYAGRDFDITMEQKGYADMDEVVFNINRALEREGIGGEMLAVADGNKVMFISSRTGSETEITVTGSDANTLGFKESSVTGTGMDTTFSMSYDNFSGPVETQHEAAVDLTAGGNYTFYVNETKIAVTIPAAATSQDVEDLINTELMNKGLGFTVYADAADNILNPTLSDITFRLQNVELNDDTALATVAVDPLTGTYDYDYDTARGSKYPTSDEKTVGDMLDFIENLYGGAVSATITDGKLQVKDLRSGESNLKFSANEQNTGISFAKTDRNITVSGAYSGMTEDTWDFSVTRTGSTIGIVVTNSKGNTVYNGTLNADTYKGSDIYITSGVSITLGEIDVPTSFSLELNANPNLSFGDLNVTEKGTNVNVFQSLDNLYDALNYNIAEGGIGAPSEWAENNDESTATPYLDGEFTGNYNDIFTFSVESTGTTSQYYLQNDQEWTSGEINYYDGMNLSFDIVINSDKLTPPVYTNNVSVTTGAGTVTDKATLLDAMVQQINADATFKSLGIKAYAEDGQLRIDTNSGNTEISVNYLNTDTVRTMESVAESSEQALTATNLEITAPTDLSIDYYDGANWQTATITIPAADYADYDAVAAAINNEIAANPGLSGNFTAEAGSSGKITISALAASGITDMLVTGDEDGTLGFYNKAGANTVSAALPATMDLSEKDTAERTITLAYNDGTADRTVSIVVDAENYQTYGELVDNINQQLADAGINSADISCERVGYNSLSFVFNSTFSKTTVAGDYNSTLGFSKGGDIVKIKITGEDGELINTYSIDSANEKYYVADGVYQYYDAGYLYASDSFTSAIGSGIEYEMEVLAKAETQLLKSLTIVGNSTSKVESAINFNENLVSTTEELKAKYTGSTTVDKTAAAAELSMAQTAYEAALQVTAKTLSVSLLDYI